MTRAIKDTDSQRLCIHIPDSEVGRHRDSCRVRAREVLEPSFSSHRPSFHRTPRHRTGCRRSCRRLPVPCRRMRLRPLWCDLGCSRRKKLRRCASNAAKGRWREKAGAAAAGRVLGLDAPHRQVRVQVFPEPQSSSNCYEAFSELEASIESKKNCLPTYRVQKDELDSS